MTTECLPSARRCETVPLVRRTWHFVVATVIGLMAVTLVFSVTRTLDEPYSPQSRFNLGFAANRSFQSALDLYPDYWPPIYPSLLWAANQHEIALRDVNAALFALTLLAFWLLIRSRLDGVRPEYPLLLVAVAHFNYINFQQITGETLMLPLSLVLCWLMLHPRALGGVAGVIACAVTLSALCLTRYFCVFWWLPIIVLDVLSRSAISLRRRALHVGALLGIVLIPFGLWLHHVYVKTGFLTGMDRFGAREHNRLFRHLIDFDGNVVQVGRTLTTDFFSMTMAGVPRAVYFPRPLSAVQGALLVLLGVGCLTGAYVVWRRRSAELPWRPPPRTVGMLAVIVAVYYAATVALWTIGNNDPISTRFLFPSYPFLILLGCCGYAWIRQTPGTILLRLPWILLYVGVIGVQCHRLWTAVAAAQ